MIVVLEGCDKTGKTTLSKKFEELGYTYLHFGAPKHGGPTALEEMSHFLTSHNTLSAIAKGHGFVLDRFHIGEMVYPPLFNREPSMDIVAFRGIERQLQFMGGFLIHCTDEVPRIAARYKQLGDETPEKFHQIGETVKSFNEIVRRTGMPGATYRIGDNMEMLVKAVKMFHDAIVPTTRQWATVYLGGDHED